MKRVFIGTLLYVAGACYAQDQGVPAFGSPNAVENQVIYDFGESWAKWKQDLKDDYGLVLNVDYTAVLLTANETFDDKDGSGGIARIYGTFDPAVCMQFFCLNWTYPRTELSTG